jgi:hypothetical protein
MSDDDLIRRGDVRAVLNGSGFAGLGCIIAALPAAPDAAVAILLRQEPDATPFKQQCMRQAIANAIRKGATP